MARNILAAGHELALYNRTRSKMEDLCAAGATPADSPRSAAQVVEVVCVCVVAPIDVRQVILGPEGALSAMDPNTVIVDFSTVDPATSQELVRACASEGIAFLDAPVSGGVSGAAAGTLTIVVGGEGVEYG